MSESVCPRAYLRNYTSAVFTIFVDVTLAMAMARSCPGSVEIRYVLPVSMDDDMFAHDGKE